MPIIIVNGKRTVVPSKNDLYEKEILTNILLALEGMGLDQASSDKQDEIISAINNISGVSSYNFVQKEDDSTNIYYGFASSTGWQIKKKEIATGVWTVASDSGDYDIAWADKENKTYNYT